MSNFVVAAHFVVLFNGAPLQVESVTVDGPSCPPAPATSVSLLAHSEGHRGVCVGLVYEAGHIRYWELTRKSDAIGSAKWFGWRTRLSVKDFTELFASRSLRLRFPETALSFDLNASMPKEIQP
ncbi:hypothetical protein MCEMSEM47_00184 [Burkholderiales bacterium]